jgi:hypothetical protein
MQLPAFGYQMHTPTMMKSWTSVKPSKHGTLGASLG